MTAKRNSKPATGRKKPTNARSAKGAPQVRGSTKLDLLVEKLARPEGATLAELTTATGWQPHSVRGALAGSLRKKGYTIQSDKVDGVRRYRVEVQP